MNKKKLDYENKKCKTCGSNIIFSPAHNGLYCKNCGNVYNIESSNNIIYHTFVNHIDDNPSHNEWSTQNKMIKCKDCGAEIILDKLEFSNTCSYCGSSVVSIIDELPGLKPDAIIPFKFDGHEASKRFSESLKKKWLIPSSLKKKAPKNDMTGTYIACFAFNTNTYSVYNGTFSYTETKRDSNGNSRTVTHYVNVSGTFIADFKDILIESNQHITDSDLVGIKPFNFNEAKSFTQDYLKGYVVEHYNENADNCFNIAQAKITQQIKRSLLSKHHCEKIERINLNINYDNKSYAYYLLPIYLFIYKYKDRIYKTIMNGQTGKLGSNVPTSGLKLFLLIFGFLSLPFIIFILIRLLI